MAKNTVMMGLAGALVCGLAGVGALGDDDPIALAPEEGVAALPPVEYTGYKCRSFTACPRTRLVSRYGELAGCTYSAEDKACSGRCYICPGSNSPAQVCVKSAGSDCVSGGQGASSCGTYIVRNDCFYATGLDLATPCGCLLIGDQNTDNEGCAVLNCAA